METKKTNERKAFLGLVEMNESQEKDVTAGSLIRDIMQPCCGMVILTDPTDILNPFRLPVLY